MCIIYIYIYIYISSKDVHSLDQERQLAEVRLAEAKQQATDR